MPKSVPQGRGDARRVESRARLLLLAVAWCVLPAAHGAFNDARYQALVAFLNDSGAAVTAGKPRQVDGELVLPKGFRVALGAFLGHGFRGNRITVGHDGRVQFVVTEPESHQYAADFACRQPGFNIQWRPGGGRDDFAVVGVKTESAACISEDGSPAGALLWRVPKGRDRAVADALGLLREIYMQGK